MATWNRYDICAAWRALENDWNHGGWLRERASNRRRMESCAVQISRIGVHFPTDYACSFEYIDDLNQMDIYVGALIQTGLNRLLSLTDETHLAICLFIRKEHADKLREHFPQLIVGGE